MKKIFFAIFFLVFVCLTLLPAQADAQGLVPCGNPGQPACSFCHTFSLLDNIISFLLVPSASNPTPIVLVVATLLFAIGGFVFFTSAGNTARLEQAKQVITATIIGLLIVYGAWVFMGLLLNSLGVTDNWWEIDCPLPFALTLTGPASIREGGDVTLEWTILGGVATKCDATGDWTDSIPPSNGSKTLLSVMGAGTTKTYALECTGPGGKTAASVNVVVQDLIVKTFNFRGEAESWPIPPDVTLINVDVRGAQGGPAGSLKAFGGRVQATLSVTAEEILFFYVGGTANGANQTTLGSPGGFNGGGKGGDSLGTNNRSGGGGGGASDIRQEGAELTNRVVVAGGGGGAGVGTNGFPGGGLRGGGDLQGGTQTSGGVGGSPNLTIGVGGENLDPLSGFAGILGFGGDGALCTVGSCHAGGGAGGGYWGGGGGGNGTWQGGGPPGGGGSNYCDLDVCTGVIHAQGSQSGNGQIIITY